MGSGSYLFIRWSASTSSAWSSRDLHNELARPLAFSKEGDRFGIFGIFGEAKPKAQVFKCLPDEFSGGSMIFYCVFIWCGPAVVVVVGCRSVWYQSLISGGVVVCRWREGVDALCNIDYVASEVCNHRDLEHNQDVMKWSHKTSKNMKTTSWRILSSSCKILNSIQNSQWNPPSQKSLSLLNEATSLVCSWRGGRHHQHRRDFDYHRWRGVCFLTARVGWSLDGLQS